MGSIWKDLLFLHGHFVRPEDLLDQVVDSAAKATTQREAAAMPAEPDAGDVICGGCA